MTSSRLDKRWSQRALITSRPSPDGSGVGKDKERNHRRSDRETERYLLFRRALIHSPQFAALSTPSRALIFELHAMHNGTNNGTVFLSVRDAAARLGFADLKAAMRAFNELSDLGWITETIGSSFKVKTDAVSRARAWRLNWIQSGRCVGPDAIPQLDFKRLSTTQKRRVRERQLALEQYLKSYQSGNFAVEESSTLDARTAFVGQADVEESSTLKVRNGENLPNPFVEESTTHISTIGVRDQRAELRPASHDPRLADGPAGELNGKDAVLAIRSKVTGHWKKLGTTARRRTWAAANGLDLDVLREYVVGNSEVIPFVKQAALVSAVRAAERADRERRTQRRAERQRQAKSA